MKYTQKTIIGTVFGAVILLGIFAAYTLARLQGPAIPFISLAVDDSYSIIEPDIYCDPFLKNCIRSDRRNILNLCSKATVILSIPHEITEGPWSVYTQYQTGNTITAPVRTYHKPGPATAIVVHTSQEHPLIALEIQAASVIGNTRGGYYSRALWAIHIEKPLVEKEPT